jgi:hypothetical protein
MTQQCTLCQKKFKSRKYLDPHMQRSNENACPICGENFVDNSEQLVAHARRHFKDDYLTLPQVKALRKITGKSVLLPVDPSSNSSNAVRASSDPILGPSGAPNMDPAFQQTSRPIHGHACIEISVTQSGTEKYSVGAV